MKSHSIILAISSMVVLFGACKKDSNCNAGSGGGLTVIARVVHHTRPINGCTVYVKYCAAEFPGADTSVYDLSFKAANDTPDVVITGLKSGDYYLYATGVDSLLDPSNWIVKGGIPFNATQDTGIVNKEVFVTEGD